MPYTTPGRHVMLDALKAQITHTGLFTKQANKSVTATTAGVFTSTGHGFAAGDVVVFSGLTGGTGLVAGDVYFVITANLAANTFSVARTPGGTQLALGSTLSAGTVNRYVELSGGSPAYARKAIAFAAAADDQIDDSTNGVVFDVPASGVVDAESYHSAVTGGNLLALVPVTQETFGAQGTYTNTDTKLGLGG